MEAFGAPPEEIEKARQAAGGSQADESGYFEVWPENWPTFKFFDSLVSQWVMAPAGDRLIYVGLNYQGVESAMRMKRISAAQRQRMFDDLQKMEQAALKVFRRQ